MRLIEPLYSSLWATCCGCVPNAGCLSFRCAAASSSGTPIYVSPPVLLYMWLLRYSYMCALVLLHMYPHTTTLLPALSTELHIRDYAYPVYSYICVPSYCYICVLILLDMFPHTPRYVSSYSIYEFSYGYMGDTSIGV